jgi:hypothetical protein
MDTIEGTWRLRAQLRGMTSGTQDPCFMRAKAWVASSFAAATWRS